MFRRLGAAASAFLLASLLGSCNLLDAASQYANIVNVKFSEEDPASSGPSIGGPDVSTAIVQFATPSYLGGKTASEIMGEYYLTDTFYVRGDNTGNSDTARFGSETVKPVLLFRIDDPNSLTPVSATIDPFVVPGGQKADLKFPVKIPLTSIPSSVLHEIAYGDSIAYYLSGTVKFDLVTPAGTISGTSQSELSLASGKIPTRTGSLDIRSLLKTLGI
jgi:hypothetical protein